jgi:hypothetical protein
MSKIDALGAKAKDSSDWSQAWKVVSRLAEARDATLRQIGEERPDSEIPSATPAQKPAGQSAAPFAPVVPDRLTRDVADIERAAAALRRAEPGLEPRPPEPETIDETRTSHSIWPLISVIWLTAVLVVTCTIGAILLLVG